MIDLISSKKFLSTQTRILHRFTGFSPWRHRFEKNIQLRKVLSHVGGESNFHHALFMQREDNDLASMHILSTWKPSKWKVWGGRDRVSRSDHTRVYENGIKKTRIKLIKTTRYVKAILHLKFFFNVVPSYEERSFQPPSMVWISVIIHYITIGQSYFTQFLRLSIENHLHKLKY